MTSAVLTLVEPGEGRISLTSREALTVARELAADSPGGEVHALVLGPTSDAILADARDYGVRAVHVATDPELESYAGAAWARALEVCAESTRATAVIAGGSPRGMEVLAHFAARWDLPMAANVVEILSPDPLEVERQVAGGKVLERTQLRPGFSDADPAESEASGAGPAVLTIAGHAFGAEPASVPSDPELRPFTAMIEPADLRAQVARVEPHAGGDTTGLATARVVVGVGRGAGGEGGFEGADALAARLGGVVGVSRVVTSMGWRPHHEQVGQSGTRISPDVYLAFGISGAAQHWAGCSSAKTIIAINTDPDSPMVTRADYAVIGDMHEVLPALLEALE